MTARFRFRAASLLAAAALLVASGAGAGDRESPAGRRAPRRVAGYFTSWSIYGKNYLIKNVKQEGAAAHLTHILYAFAKIGPDLKCAIADPWADYQKPFDATQSVDGEAETWSDTQVRGNFNQLRKLRLEFPQLKVLISVGGWTFSDKFSDAALTPASREALARSCVDMFVRGNVAPGISQPGLFDGIDLDWEYPGACGNTCNFRPEDTENFTALLAEFRRQLDAAGVETGRRYLLAIAAPAIESLFTKIQLDRIHPQLDFINLLSYDFHGGWENATNFHAPLLPSSADPGGPKANVHFAVTSYLRGGVPARKLGIGIPLYGRGWAGVPDARHGLYQPATGTAPGSEPGIQDFRVLRTLDASYRHFRDLRTLGHWVYSAEAGIFWGYDDPATIFLKGLYARGMGLGGVMLWDLGADDAEASLVRAAARGLR